MFKFFLPFTSKSDHTFNGIIVILQNDTPSLMNICVKLFYFNPSIDGEVNAWKNLFSAHLTTDL